MTAIHQARRFLETARKSMRHGELSRERLILLRVQWTPDHVECDWLMRKNDPWDVDLEAEMARQHQTLQALRDALELRNLVFRSFPSAATAELRMFDVSTSGDLELIMSGSVARANEVYYRVPSLAMRARLCGFQFTLANGVFEIRDRSGRSAA